MQEDQQKLAEKQSQTNILYIAIGGMILITGILIFTTKHG
jgi:hypothetical protein